MQVRNKVLGVGLAASALVAAGLAGPAGAADDTTTVTFTLSVGALSITAPETTDFGTLTYGTISTVGGQLGAVTVTDNRGGLAQTWAASAASSNFTESGGGSIPATSVLYSTGTLTATNVTAVSATSSGALALALPASAVPVVTATLGSPSNSTSWNPTLTIPVTATTPAGSYSGTITHSVS